MTDLAIVIPAFKETYLKEALESIAQQTDKRFHLYIGDDCSPYDIETIVKEYQSRIPLTYKRFDTNLGGKDLVGQWERCIALTEGEPNIWLFSDDDTMSPNCVASFYSLPEEIRSNSLIHFNINMIDELEGKQIKSLPQFPHRMTAGEYLKAKLEGKIVSYVVEFIFSRSLYERVGGFQNFDLAWGTDFMTWLKMAAESKNGIITIQGLHCMVNWRRSAENISPNSSKPILVRKIKAFIANASFLRKEISKRQVSYAPCKSSFRWLRFPLGEIYRNRKILSRHEIQSLCKKYSVSVGYPMLTLLVYWVILLRK